VDYLAPKRSIEAAEASYQANAADVENVRLLVTSQLAGDYFNLRELDSELQILTRTWKPSKRIGPGKFTPQWRRRFRIGDVAQEETC